MTRVPLGLSREAKFDTALFSSSSEEHAAWRTKQVATQSKVLGVVPDGRTLGRCMSHLNTPRIFFLNSSGPVGQDSLPQKSDSFNSGSIV